MLKKLTRIVFNKWYSETLMENAIVVPEEPSDKKSVSPSRKKQTQKTLNTQAEFDSHDKGLLRSDSAELSHNR